MARTKLKCQYCGTEVSQNAPFCGECGSRITPQFPAYVLEDTPQQQQKTHSNGKWPVIVSIVLIICMLGAMLYLLYTEPDGEKRPEQMQVAGVTQTTAPPETKPRTVKLPTPTTTPDQPTEDLVPEQTTEAFIPEQTTEVTIPEETEAMVKLELNRKDITMVMQGEKWKLYDGQIPLDAISWYSDDEKVAVIRRGVVEAVGKGTTNVHAEYGDQKVSCIIRCSFEESSGGLPGTGNLGEDGGDSSSALTYSICAYGSPITDVTIYKELADITFRDSNGKVIDVTWESTDTSIFTVSEFGDGCVLKAVAVGTAKLKAVHNGKVYLCIVRVAA